MNTLKMSPDRSTRTASTWGTPQSVARALLALLLLATALVVPAAPAQASSSSFLRVCPETNWYRNSGLCDLYAGAGIQTAIGSISAGGTIEIVGEPWYTYDLSSVAPDPTQNPYTISLPSRDVTRDAVLTIDRSVSINGIGTVAPTIRLDSRDDLFRVADQSVVRFDRLRLEQVDAAGRLIAVTNNATTRIHDVEFDLLVAGNSARVAIAAYDQATLNISDSDIRGGRIVFGNSAQSDFIRRVNTYDQDKGIHAWADDRIDGPRIALIEDSNFHDASDEPIYLLGTVGTTVIRDVEIIRCGEEAIDAEYSDLRLENVVIQECPGNFNLSGRHGISAKFGNLSMVGGSVDSSFGSGIFLRDNAATLISVDLLNNGHGADAAGTPDSYQSYEANGLTVKGSSTVDVWFSTFSGNARYDIETTGNSSVSVVGSGNLSCFNNGGTITGC